MTTSNSPAVGPVGRCSDIAPVNFVIIGHPRCGSNLLVRALALHPQTRMAGELLAQDQAVRKTAWERVSPLAWPHPRGKGYQAGENAADFISQRVFSSTPFDNIRAFGFKIFYNHARSDEAMATIWEYLKANPIRVIHIERRNLLASYVSNEIALKTNEWHRPVDGQTTARASFPPFELDPLATENYFADILNWRAWADKTFADHRLLKVSYEEDLCCDFGATANRVFEFLDVMPWITHPGLQKQQALPLREQISNYPALRRHFRKTPYAGFFEEEDRAALAAGNAESKPKGILASLLSWKQA